MSAGAPLVVLFLVLVSVPTHASDSTVVVTDTLGVSLLAAAEGGQLDRIQELLGNGADIESKDKYGRTPLMVAAVAGQLSAVQLLLDRGGKLSARNIHGSDTFDFAVGNDRAEIVDTLAGRGVDLKERGGPALLVTASRGGISTAIVLLKHGVGVNCRDTSGATPLMRAVASRQRSMVAFLIEHGADVNAADNRGASPLSSALVGPWGRDTKIAKMLKQAGARE